MPTEPPRIFTLPLFPLSKVLFPQFPLQLHIFEERYKVMINQCIDNDAPFGVVLIREGQEVGKTASPHDVGCVARILGVERLKDGRLNILAVCERRFRVLDYMEADYSYLIGRVEELDDEPEYSDVSQLTTDLTELFIRYLRLLANHVQLPMPELELPDDPKKLAFCVASVAMLPPLRQQELLELTDTRARLENELKLLQEQVAELEASLLASELEADRLPTSRYNRRGDRNKQESALKNRLENELQNELENELENELAEELKEELAEELKEELEEELEEDSPQILIAHPINLKTTYWREYIQSLRH